ncbi:MAG: glycoside-pentoside-hexuronide (GPH):cation symporter [Lachnospiraceae bacterium]|jgi:sugar (glycoside-pentoside-hexuronide) transporter
MKKVKTPNRFTFGLGTFGRDMVYTLISMYLMFYLTDVLSLSTNTLWWITTIILCCRIFDALNDPFMGMIVDNTKTRYGRFKPWICVGAVLAGAVAICLFYDMSGLSETGFILVFGLLYLAWGIFYTMNDISYWSMLPSLTQDQREREEIGSIARVCANLGLFLVVALIVPITGILGNAFGSLQKGYFVLSIILVGIMLIFQSITVFGVKEPPESFNRPKQHTSVREMLRVIFKNDQLLVTAIAMALFTIGYFTTTSFGLYYFKYVFDNEGMYSVFAVILGVSQIAALIVFPILGKRFPRKRLYLVATIMVVVGYVIFFFAPTNTFIFIGIAGVILFVGQAFIQIMTLMFLTDSVDYGEWKFGKRNDSVTFSLQPFINKMGGAVASGITGVTVIISGMKEAESAVDMTPSGLMILKVAMMILPLLCILASFVIYIRKYKIDEETYAQIISDLNRRKEAIND